LDFLMRLSVIIPVYKEEATLAEVIRRVRAIGLAHEIIVVDDGSTDRSPQILVELQSKGTLPLTILCHERNQCKGAAVRTGLAALTGDLVLVQDADLEYDPADYTALLAPFATPTVEAVYSSRNLRRNLRSSFAFYWGGRLLSWIANWWYPIADLIRGHQRAWFVYPYTRRPTHYPMQPLMPDGYWYQDPKRDPRVTAWLKARADAVQDYQHFCGIEIWLTALTAGR
jgi:glycosyltransferase involved in cell wall biosynthesis